MPKKPLSKLLIANRGEVALRIARAAEELGIATLAVFAEDEAQSLHPKRTDEAVGLRGRGPGAYLDAEQLLAVARERGCDAVHPGYGFLSESAAFAEACAGHGLTFVGPTPQQLRALGDKLEARALAQRLGVPVARGSAELSDVDLARAFFVTLDGRPALLKATAGGGGRGMRRVDRVEELDEAFARCQSEAASAFGHGALYLEECLERPRHIEVQIMGDGLQVSHLWERECSLQRRRQKVVEIAPSPALSPTLRGALCEAAKALASAVGYRGLGTFEFLVSDDARFVFMEANPRLQVEHTVTEEVLGLDLVKAQLEIAAGATLAELGLLQEQVPSPRGYAVQFRLNAERVGQDGRVTPATGTLRSCELPAGPGVRVDHAVYPGLVLGPAFDPLLLKLIVHAPHPEFRAVVRKARRALAELSLSGVDTNLTLLENLVDDPAFAEHGFHTTFLEDHAARLSARRGPRRLAFASPEFSTGDTPVAEPVPEGLVGVVSPLFGRLVQLDVAEGERVRKGQQLCVLEAMKMESAVCAERSGVLCELRVQKGDMVQEGQLLCALEPSAESGAAQVEHEPRLREPRKDLEEARARHRNLLDEHRPEAVQKRRKLGLRTARENLNDLVDADSFVEYGGLALAAQRSSRPMDKLMQMSPADGIITGVGTVNAELFGPEASRCAVAAYDYTVLAGTQGHANHQKQDRLFELCERERLPVVLFAEGGGGRPGDTDHPLRPTLDTQTFRRFANLSGLVPLVGVVSGRCFAGNAVLLGCCDTIIATENSNVGMGGPVMVEGAGIGSFPPEAIGPIDVQSKSGVVDVRVRDEAEGVAVARRYLAFFQGRAHRFEAPDAEPLRDLVPENRMRVYDMRAAIVGIADVGSVLELRREYAPGLITALARIEGRSVGVLGNDPRRLAGAVDAACADKAARFMRLCNAFDIPLISLCDTPGFMVGPETEKTAAVRRTCRMLVSAAQLEVPLICVVLRKAYGLGAMGMAGGHLHAPLLTLSWPSGEFGAMGLEGAVQLAFKKQLNAIADPAQRDAVMRKMADGLREQGKATNVASLLEIDDVIDPADTRAIIARTLSTAHPRQRSPAARRFIDTW